MDLTVGFINIFSYNIEKKIYDNQTNF
jgi:hypothetical protein